MPDLKHFLSLLAIVTGSLSALAQPTVISPRDVAEFHQSTSITENFTYGPAYDLESPLELYVKIHRVITPDDGYALMAFSITDVGEGFEGIELNKQRKFIATLQLSKKFKAKLEERGLDKKRFSKGVPAVLYGWPATEWNTTDSAFLVDELVLTKSNRRLVFHKANEIAVKHPNTTGTDTD
ncbi:hypothetical protein [Parahalioglobus pacificus]|uniref:Secreted protein n=1 Tax=Parahalioglobus pacificus TaxID=930806 RepID=A0A919CJY0_9GAMM|nr:hypothetical protein [Halioglobus pacificus]GHD29550.1 hypothetical protein GCM10007053_10280 [Halioglobus pacificus]